jgi:hydroxypyruvate isomerase
MNPKIKQAVAWWCFVPAKMAPDAFIRTVRQIGFDGLEMVPVEQRQRVRDQGLTIVSIAGHHSISEGLNRRENHSRIEHELLESIQEAVSWDISQLICFSGNRQGLNDQAGAEATAEGLRRVATAAEEAGVTLLLELLNSRRDHIDYQFDRTAWGVDVCQRVASPRVKILYDLYHAKVMGEDTSLIVGAHHPWLGHYHTAGYPGRNELVGASGPDYPSIFRTLRDVGYAGWIGHEFIPAGDPATSLRQAWNLVRTNTATPLRHP